MSCIVCSFACLIVASLHRCNTNHLNSTI